MIEYALFALVGLFASTLSTLCGFGAAMTLIPFVSLFTDLKTAIMLVSVFHAISNLIKLLFMHRSVDWKTVFVFGLPSIGATIFGAYCLSIIETDILKVAFGMTLIGFALLL